MLCASTSAALSWPYLIWIRATLSMASFFFFFLSLLCSFLLCSGPAQTVMPRQLRARHRQTLTRTQKQRAKRQRGKKAKKAKASSRRAWCLRKSEVRVPLGACFCDVCVAVLPGFAAALVEMVNTVQAQGELYRHSAAELLELCSRFARKCTLSFSTSRFLTCCCSGFACGELLVVRGMVHALLRLYFGVAPLSAAVCAFVVCP